LADILARLFYGEPATPASLASDPAVAALQQQFHAALNEMRRIRDAIIDEQQRTSLAVTDTQQRLTNLTEIVTELRTFLPINPKQAEYIQRAIKRLATRLHKQRQSSDAGYRQTEDNLYQLLFGQFKVDMGIPRYDALPIDKYDAAVAWIERKAAELLPGDPDAVAPRQEAFL
jgi:TolA-binding protein